MALVLKSNVASLKFLFDRSGIRDTDYLFNADFTQDFYIVNSNSSNFANIIDYNRVGAAHYFEDDKVQTVAENIPVRLSPEGSTGLWNQFTAWNALGSGEMTTSKTMNFTAAADLGATYALQVFGTGSVIVSGDALTVEHGMTATTSNAVIFKTVSNGGKSNVTFTVVGDVKHYQIQRVNAYALPNIIKDITSAATVRLKPDLLRDEFVMLIRLKPNYNAIKTVSGLFEIASENNLITAYFATNGALRIRGRNNVDIGATSAELEHTGDVTIVVRFGKSKLQGYYKGEKVLDIVANATSTVAYIKFLSGQTFATGPCTGLLKNIVCYTKSMTDDELKLLSMTYL